MNLIILGLVTIIVCFVVFIGFIIALRKSSYVKRQNKASQQLTESLCLNFGDVRISNEFVHAMTKLTLGISDPYAARIYLDSFNYIYNNLLNDPAKDIQKDEIAEEKDDTKKALAILKNSFFLDALSAASYNCGEPRIGKRLLKYFRKLGKDYPFYENKVITIRLEMDKKLQKVFDSIWENSCYQRNNEAHSTPLHSSSSSQ